MKIELYFLKDYIYTTESIPIMFKLITDRDIELSSKWDVKSILILQDGEEKEGIFSTPALGLKQGTYFLEKRQFKYFSLDICERMRGYDWDLPVGRYELNIEIMFYEVGEDEKYYYHILEAGGEFFIQ